MQRNHSGMRRLATGIRCCTGVGQATVVALAGLLISTSGCATIVSGTKQKVEFSSTPSGAAVAVDGGTYTTPCEVKLSRGKNHDVEFSLPDYLPVKHQILRTTNGWAFGNILLGGLIGLMVDYATGAVNDLAPERMHVELVTAGAQRVVGQEAVSTP
jgi:hypothetical protein